MHRLTMHARWIASAALAALVAAGCGAARGPDSGGVTAASAASGCTHCHGGGDNATGAPPVSLHGSSDRADPGVGAHTAHVTAGALAGAFECQACHPDPRLGSAVHLDGQVELAFGELASTGGATPTFGAADATCSNVYCHGAFRNGRADNAPRWTAPPAGDLCGTCHGIPPPAPHPAVGADRTVCSGCHPTTVDATGAIVPAALGGTHVDGKLDGGGHDASWMDTTSAGFHAFAADRGLPGCTACHGAQLDGGSAGVACARCHDRALPAGVTSWRQDCTMCHGGVDNGTGAPPRAVWGQAGDPARGGGVADPMRVGAHTAHVTGSGFAAAIDCSTCHVKPASALDPGHVTGTTAAVTFSGLAAAGSASTAFSRADGTCAVYCHGATLQGGSSSTPRWTLVGQGQAACGTCHGLPPPQPHPIVNGGVTACAACHPDSVDALGNVKPAPAGQHLDGQVEFSGGHDASWMDPTSPGFHAFSAAAGVSACQVCHGANLDGVGGLTTVACASCHQAGGTAHDFSTCTACHGGGDNRTGAPPVATWGHAGDPARGGGTLDAVRVGAHTTHVTASAFAPAFGCAVCHVVPTSIVSTGHLDGPTATVTFSGLAIAGNVGAAFTRATATCVTYCHGATLSGGSIAQPTWTAVGQGQAACGTCHGTPPGGNHPAVSSNLSGCSACHPDSVDSAGNVKPAPAGKHLDGTVEAIGSHDAAWIDPSSSGFHAVTVVSSGIASCQGCHGPNLDGVGGVTSVACASCHRAGGSARDFATCTTCHGGTDNQTGAPPAATWGHAGDPNRGGGTLDAVRVGAHSRHVADGPLAKAFDCGVCHVVPASIVSAGHVDGPTATVTWSGLASLRPPPATGAPAVPAPVWDRTTATCANTYCHGATIRADESVLGSSPRGTNVTPLWTGGAPQAACGTCHGLPPDTGRHWDHVNGTLNLPCSWCHAGYQDPPATSVPAAVLPLHVNGTKDVVISADAAVPGDAGTRIQGWDSASCHTVVACHGQIY